MDFFNKLPVNQRFVLAPMVDQCDLAFRTMVRRHGCALPYTQMIIANQFISDAEYRAKTFATSRGDGINTDDRPLVVQIAGSDPDTLLECARMLQNHCDAIDLNLGCPQHRAITDGYGASLLHKEKWPTVSQIVRLLSATLSVPIWCKIRLIPNNQTPAFAEMLQASGCKLITVHGRYASATRRRNGAADLDAIRAVKDAVSIPVVANGNVRGVEDLQRNMRLTGADGIMVGEAILVNPYIFEGSQTPENPSDIIREYLEICAQVPPAAFSIISARQHIRNFLRPNVRSNSPQFKEALQRAVTIPEILTKMTSQLQFDISVCTVADAQGIGRVNMSAFWDDVNWQLVWATKTLDYVVQQNAKRLPHSLALASSRIHQRHLKVVDSATGIVVGYGRFILPEQLKNEWLDAQVPEPPAEDKDKLLELYNSADWSMTHVADDVDAPVTELKHKHFRTENIVLDRLAVLPEYQRRGIGKLLLSQVVEVADQFGVDISVLGKPKGTSLYSKHGFKILGTITQNLAQFGGTDNYTWSVLEYEAKKN